MKTIKAIFAIIIATFTVSAVSASGGLKVDMSNSASELTVVEISSAKISNFEIDLISSYGDKVYSMETKAPANKLKKSYDFSGLEDGTYWYSVKIDNEKTLNKLEVKDGKAEMLEVRKSVDPHFKMDGEMLKISFLNPQQENVKLYVYDNARKLLSESSLGSDFAIHQAVNLSELRYGTYEVVVANDWDVYEYKVSLD